MKKLKMTKDYAGYKKGDIIVVSDNVFETLVDAGAVETKKVKAKKAKTKDMKAEDCESGKCSPKKTYKTKVVSSEK